MSGVVPDKDPEHVCPQVGADEWNIERSRGMRDWRPYREDHTSGRLEVECVELKPDRSCKGESQRMSCIPDSVVGTEDQGAVNRSVARLSLVICLSVERQICESAKRTVCLDTTWNTRRRRKRGKEN